ncbi:MAG: hypothetical protein IKU52_03245 [Clostridia bacterium]|nr:hypothetical protein [Clostridia bacterium]
MNNDLSRVTKTLSEREKIAAIIWLIIGILQVCSCVFCISGGWNIYASITRFKQSKAVLTPWPGIVNAYDSWIKNIIICLVINIVFGGVIGAAGCLYDIFLVRDHVLKNKQVFADAGL